MEKIALGQLHIEYGKFETNVGKALEFINSAANSGCSLILFPELWSSGFDYANLVYYSKKNLDLLSHLQDLADKHHISIGGSLIQQTKDGFSNSFHLIQPNKELVSYNKIHLFSLMNENEHLVAGELASVFHSNLGFTGAAICFDLRFPEHFIRLSDSGAEVFLLPAHWPLERIHHWDVLLQARAIENQAYMIAVNSTGVSKGHKYGGHSTVIAPDGNVLLQAPVDQEGLFTSFIDLTEVTQIRQAFPIRKRIIT